MQRRLRGGGARVGCGCSPRRGRAIWLGGPPLAVPPPCPGVTQQGAPGSSFEDQPVCGSRWPGWGPPRPGSGPVGVSWQGTGATFFPDPRSRALAGRLWPQDRQGNQVQAPPSPRSRALPHPLPPSVGLCPAGAVAVRPEQEVGGLGSRGQAWLQAGFLPSLLSGQESERR